MSQNPPSTPPPYTGSDPATQSDPSSVPSPPMPPSPTSSTAALVPKSPPPQRKNVLERLLSSSKHPYTYMSDMGLAVDAAQTSASASASSSAASKRKSSDGGKKGGAK